MRLALLSILAYGAFAQQCENESANLDAADCANWQYVYETFNMQLVDPSNPDCASPSLVRNNPCLCGKEEENPILFQVYTSCNTENTAIIKVSIHYKPNCGMYCVTPLPGQFPVFSNAKYVNYYNDPNEQETSLTINLELLSPYNSLQVINFYSMDNYPTVDFTGYGNVNPTYYQIGKVRAVTGNIPSYVLSASHCSISICINQPACDQQNVICANYGPPLAHSHAELSAPHAHAGGSSDHEHPTDRGTPGSTWAALGLGSAALLAV